MPLSFVGQRVRPSDQGGWKINTSKLGASLDGGFNVHDSLLFGRLKDKVLRSKTPWRCRWMDTGMKVSGSNDLAKEFLLSDFLSVGSQAIS